LNNLVSLDVSKNFLHDIPCVNNKLEFLNISNNFFTMLPKSIYTQPNLRVILIENTSIYSLPLDSLNWENVEIISVYSSGLSAEKIDTLKMKFGSEIVINHPKLI